MNHLKVLRQNFDRVYETFEFFLSSHQSPQTVSAGSAERYFI